MAYTIKETFLTLQGEGRRAGALSVFCRVAGCNAWTGRAESRHAGKLDCSKWCDTDFFKGTRMSAEEIVEKLDQLWPQRTTGAPKWVVLTGGEPALQYDAELFNALRSSDWRIAMETNGTVQIEAPVDWLTVSPKRGELELVVLAADELKVVLPGAAPGLPGWTYGELEELAKFGRWGNLYVQPQDVVDQGTVEVSYLKRDQASRDAAAKQQFEKNLSQCVDFIKAHPEWSLSVQSHKFIGMP
jgi:organic radical activating enzyme